MTEEQREQVRNEQRTLSQLVEREVSHCASYLISGLLNDLHEDCEERATIEEALGGTEDFQEPATEWLREASDEDKAELVYQYDLRPSELSDDELLSSDFMAENIAEEQGLTPYYQDCLEHWIVSDWFGEQLQASGECVAEVYGLTIWGRTCSGQSISLDGVLKQIASGMGILPGQPNAWN